MKTFSPVYVVVRIILYSLLMFGMAEAIRFDALHPVGDSFFSEYTLTEFGQELILFILFIFFLFLGQNWKETRPVAIVASLFFLISFFREFNFLTNYWNVPAVLTLALIIWIVYRDRKKIESSTIAFFSQPASAWLISGFLVTYIFSRLFGRSKFWLILYDENHYRLAKAVAEEGLELLGNTLMLIAAVEFYLALRMHRKQSLK